MYSAFDLNFTRSLLKWYNNICETSSFSIYLFEITWFDLYSELSIVRKYRNWDVRQNREWEPYVVLDLQIYL